MTKMVEGCPECGSSSIRLNATRRIRVEDADRYRCKGCGETFDETVTVEAPSNRQPTTGLARVLADIGEARSDG